MRIAVASDHAGFILKEALKTYLSKQGDEVVDFGAPNDERSDYPDFAFPAARAVAAGGVSSAILICGSGIGMNIVANRIPRVRAAVLHNEEEARLARLHNDANVACLAARSLDLPTARRVIEVFCNTPFAGGRHAVRVKKIDGGG